MPAAPPPEGSVSATSPDALQRAVAAGVVAGADVAGAVVAGALGVGDADALAGADVAEPELDADVVGSACGSPPPHAVSSRAAAAAAVVMVNAWEIR
ncbi:hypothetical protein ACU18_05400 [Arthrobacter sp. ZBG10]|nr:hypothetical protein ACU18_05400 [Arthrobacter sp. ZBG10]KQR01927.1 hypothetical protein ASF72_12205 [Arthrobacter sp. Leaf141]